MSLNPPRADDYCDAPDGGPAFPKVPDDSRNGSSGMSLRDWFAGLAAAQLITDDSMPAYANQVGQDAGTCVAQIAYQLADAMLAARAGKTEGRQP